MRELISKRKYDPNSAQMGINDARKAESAVEEYDVRYLINCLENERDTVYNLVEKPDAKHRTARKVDYLFEEENTEKQLAIEHVRMFESENARKNLVFIVREYEDRIIFPPMYLPTPKDLAGRINLLVIQKRNKGQFKDYAHAERILLIRNKCNEVRPRRIQQSEAYLNRVEMKKYCDHCYILCIDGTILQLL